MDLGFKLKYQSKNSRARVGELRTAHGVIQTPAFVPVGTQATVKGLTPEDLKNLGAQCVLANTYHLYLRPGAEVIAQMGGLHGFMNWDGPVFTDSGGFQVMSLGVGLEHEVGKMVDLFADDSREEEAMNEKLKIKNQKLKIKEKTDLLDVRSFCKVDEEGVTFMSHLDGTLHRWTAEKAMQVQKLLGADIVFAMDECTSPLHDYEYTSRSMERSHRWEERSIKEFKVHSSKFKVAGEQQLLYGIVQGGPFENLRKESARWVSGQEFDGLATGGALVSKKQMAEILDWTVPLLPEGKSRHLLGIGEIDDLFMGVMAGVDTFDCAHPTRIARRGHLYISPSNGGSGQNRWRMAIGRQEFAIDNQPLDAGCDCYTCQNFSRAYLRHLYWARELTYYRLATIHNLRFIHRLMEEVRGAIEERKLERLVERWMR